MKGFANEKACVNGVLIWHVCIYFKFLIEQIHIEVSFYCCKNCLVMYRLFNAPVRGNPPCQLYLAQILQSPEQMLGNFSILCIST